MRGVRDGDLLERHRGLQRGHLRRLPRGDLWPHHRRLGVRELRRGLVPKRHGQQHSVRQLRRRVLLDHDGGYGVKQLHGLRCRHLPDRHRGHRLHGVPKRLLLGGDRPISVDDLRSLRGGHLLRVGRGSVH